MQLYLKKKYLKQLIKYRLIQYTINKTGRNLMNQPNQQIEAERKKDQEEYNTFLYKFQQQIIDAWKPVPYTKNNVILYSVLSTFSIYQSFCLLSHRNCFDTHSSSTPEIQMKYNDQAQGDSNVITVDFTLTDALPQPSFLYYGLTNYYQNHRRYLKYFSPDQMNGKTIDESTAKSSCGQNAYKNSQIGATLSVNMTSLSPDAIAHPCGQRAKSYLEIKPEIDTIKLMYPNGTYVNLNRQGVAWPDDSRTYKDTGDLSNQAISNTDEAWLVWFRPAAKSKFFKLHSRIETDLPAGNYKFQVTDRFNASFGQKWFHLSKSNYVGNRDHFLGIAFLVLSGGCLIVLIVFIAKCVTEMRDKAKQE